MPKNKAQKRKNLRSKQKLRFSTKLHDDMCAKNVYMDYSRRPEDYIR